jgi:hypothetical protein
MKKIAILIVVLLATMNNLFGQSFRNDSDVQSYLEGKTYYNSELNLRIQYGYISNYNTYGIKVKNKFGDQFYYVNVSISTYDSFADLFGIGSSDGRQFGFRLYGNKLIVGRGESTEYTFYLE